MSAGFPTLTIENENQLKCRNNTEISDYADRAGIWMRNENLLKIQNIVEISDCTDRAEIWMVAPSGNSGPNFAYFC
ncbi:hypothetical protein V9T40_011918 [Parthenolecanium corni]|uniref:Uncharacterized protein n=1 Tax=Parthenolecanium corni TaxID=536013 RepID=A0AAN9T678_9HEMI